MHFDPQLLPDSSGDLPGQVAAQARVRAAAALNEGFDQARFVKVMLEASKAGRD